MSASPKQVKLIDELQSRGATIPADDRGEPDFSMFDSVAAADAYIKQWGHLMARHRTKTTAADWGGIPNH